MKYLVNVWFRRLLVLLLFVGIFFQVPADNGALDYYACTKAYSNVMMLGDTLDAPELACLSVLDSGEVDVTWVPVNDPSGSFYCYILYRGSTFSGPFSLVDTLWSVNDLYYQDISPGALPGSYYYLSTVSEVMPQQYVETPGDTMQAILLTAVSPGPNSGTAQLNWNNPFHNHQQTNPYYHIYKRRPPAGWKLLDSTQANSWLDTILVCQGELKYQIRVPTNHGCEIISNADGGTFENKIPPKTPEIDSVTVINQQVHITWEQGTADDLWGYILFKEINSLWTPLDTIFGASNIHYLDSIADGCAEVNRYNVLAFDSCWNTSPSGQRHRNMVLTVQHDVCKGQAVLDWTDYANMRPSLEGYRIYRSQDHGPFQLVHQSSPQVTAWVDTTLDDSTHYCYFVRAVNPQHTRSSTTCESCFFHSVPTPPQYVYMATVTVDHSNGNIRVRGVADTSEILTGVTIYRSDQPASGYQLMATLGTSADGSFSWEDNQVLTDSLIYYYQAFALDSCHNEVTESNVPNNMVLDGAYDGFMENLLLWNAFEGWSGAPTTYSIHRRAVPNSYYTTAEGNMSYDGGSYVDDVSSLYETSGDFYYYVIAWEGAGNPYGISDSSRSNRVFVRQEEKVFVPNAFTPGGHNPVFKPFNVYMDFDDYQFAVYNRWGEQVFHSTNPEEGWDGSINGNLARLDTYIYVLSFRTKNGESVRQKGSVILLR